MKWIILINLSWFLGISLIAQTVHNIQITSFSFAPNNLSNVLIGDTIRFTLVSGNHTVVSTNVPPGANTFNFPTGSGDYIPNVVGTYEYQCGIHNSMKGSFTVASTSKSNVKNDNIEFYPTNVSNFINIKSDKSIELVQIHNLLGTNLLQETPNSNYLKLELEHLPNGCYFLTVKTVIGTITQKIIKH